MRTIFLGSDWDVHRVQVKSRGALATGLTVRALLSATPDGAAIHASLALASLTELAAGEYIGTIEGSDLTAHLLTLWQAANARRKALVIYERVIVDTEDYSDVEPLTVERDRPAVSA